MALPARVAVLVGSTRTVRIAPQVAKFVHDTITEKAGSDEKQQQTSRRAANLEILDLRDYSLPIFDEPGIPNRVKSPEDYVHEHTRRWARTITSFDAFIFVSSQRNWGIPAELKNSIDFLFNEWKDKPAMIVTYGGHGGTHAGGQLNIVLKSIGMRLADKMVSMAFPSAEFREKAFRGEDLGLDASNDNSPWNEHREQITGIFWNELMKEIDRA